MEWKAEIQNINGVKQLLWECGYKKGTMVGDFSTEPDDLVAFVKEFFGEERVKALEAQKNFKRATHKDNKERFLEEHLPR